MTDASSGNNHAKEFEAFIRSAVKEAEYQAYNMVIHLVDGMLPHAGPAQVTALEFLREGVVELRDIQ